MGKEVMDWDRHDESCQAGFAAAAAHVEGFMQEPPATGEEGSWRILAANAYFAYCKAAHEAPMHLEDIPPDTLRAWEAFARHCANMMDYDPAEGDDGGLEEHESYWTEWAGRKKAEASMPQQVAAAQRPTEDSA
jgi:hypothetical protein